MFRLWAHRHNLTEGLVVKFKLAQHACEEGHYNYCNEVEI